MDISKSGVTVFTPPPSTSYRYIIELKNNKMSIWVENCSSKKQWLKSDMLQDDYVTSANTIPNASPADYVKCFYDCLDCNLNNCCPVQRSLTELTGDKVRLELTLTIPFLRSTWVAKYQFDLNPMPMDRIDVLESMMRDQNDELKRLRNELNAAKAIPFIKLEADCVDEQHRLRWNKVDCADFVVTNEDGVIKARTQGVYSIRGVINSAPSKDDESVLARDKQSRVSLARDSRLSSSRPEWNNLPNRLSQSTTESHTCATNDSRDSVMILKNGKCIQRSYCGSTGRRFVSTPLDCVALVEEGDALTITCESDSVSKCYLSIVAIVRN